MEWDRIKGKTIKDIEEFPHRAELWIEFTDGSRLTIQGQGYEEELSEVTSEWIFEPLEVSYGEWRNEK